jgi:hypothetical protein
MKKLLIALLLFVVAVVVGLTSKHQTQTAGTSRPAVTKPASQPSRDNGHMQYAAKGRVPAYYPIEPGKAQLPPTLSPELFTGNIKLAYQSAKDIPQTLAQLPCYCHCDRGHNHKSLHSCFESEHGENCGICIGEALMAHNLHKQGVAVGEIRKRVITAYGQN